MAATLKFDVTKLFDKGRTSNGSSVAVKFDPVTSDRTSNSVATDVATYSLTYSQLNDNADKICSKLRDIGVHHQIIACSAEPHLNVPSKMLGIMRVPAAFFFVDLSNSLTRDHQLNSLAGNGIKYVLADVDTLTETDRRFLETVSSKVSTIGGLHGSRRGILLLELPTANAVTYEYGDGWNLAYATTTSGTTGVAKFVKVPHRCILPNIVHFRNTFNVSPEDVILVASPLTFDPSVVDIFLALSSGASIVLVAENVKRIPRSLAAVLLAERNRISILQATPSLMRRFGVDLLKTTILGPKCSLRVLALGGEPCPSVAELRSWTEVSRRDNNGKLSVEMYNVYGTTEVSAWASLHRIIMNEKTSCPDGRQFEENINLGEPIPGTEMVVQDENGLRIECGEGQLFLGGRERICFIDDEDSSVVSNRPLVLRPTGDLVRIDAGNGHIYHLGRIDDMVKRNGKLVSLKRYENMMASFSNASARAVWDRSRRTLVLAVVVPNCAQMATATRQELVQKFRHHVLSYGVIYRPDSIVLLDSLPITAHGKFDESRVISLAEAQFAMQEDCDIDIGNGNDVCTQLKRIWNSARNSADLAEAVNDEDNFVLSGGDSIGAVTFCDDVRRRFRSSRRRLSQLMDKVLHETFANVHQYLLSVERLNDSNIVDETSDTSIAKTISESSIAKNRRSPCTVVNAISRGCSTSLSQWTQLTSGAESEANRTFGGKIDFNVAWHCDTGKCVDASPLLVCDHFGRWTVFIGSHSRAFVAIDVESGHVRWRFTADDRIESSACASPCSKYVFVGSYDRHLYCLSAEFGQLVWKFETGGTVKSSSVCHPQTATVFFGSHDRSVYALDTKTGSCRWTRKPSEGSIFSSPCLLLEPFHHLYVGSLDGMFCALCPDTGRKIWAQNCGRPLFSSPAVTSVGVCIGCVDCTLYCFSHTGTQLWRFVCEAPIFSTPCFHRTEDDDDVDEAVIFGSHDRRVYSVRADDGRVRWKSERLESEIYSTPFARKSEIFVCTTRGNVRALHPRDGTELGEYRLAGDVFSSPVALRDRLLVGCRDNRLYCLNVNRCK